MTQPDRFIALHIFAGCLLLCAGLLGLDQGIAEQLHASGLERLWLFDRGTVLLDTISGKDLSKFLIGLVLTAGALALLTHSRTRAPGRSVLLVGAVQLLSTLIAGVSKNAFDRLRPFQVLDGGDWNHVWFAGGSAFPSGHAGFYFGLFMPLAWLFPKWRWPLMITPWFIAIARVNANDHFLSDVAASIVLAGVLTLLCVRYLGKSQPAEA
jgi:membrane-associated phospholipid phosphatase